jgi:exodeoxyribonuclease V beta subunit
MNPARPAFDVFKASLKGLNLIEASAGTGKTWNICALYLRVLLERKLEVQKILVVTFTNAATAELRERIRARVVEALECLRGRAPADDPFAANLISAVEQSSGRTTSEMQALLEAALSCFDEAAIYTIHGFCQRALADTPLAAGLPYGLELIEDDTELRHEAAADFWRREVAGKQTDPDLAAWLVARYDSPAAWATLLKRLQAKPLSKQLWPESLDTPAEPLRGPLDEAFAAARVLWDRERDRAVAAVMAGIGSLNANSYKLDAINESARDWDAWFATGDSLSSIFKPDKSKARLFSSAFLASKTNKGKVIPRHAFFDAACTLLECREDMEDQLQRLRLRLLRKMAEETVEQLRDKKRARRVIGFDDILYNAWDALCNGARPWLATELRSRYPAALIDEFQDTDPLQCAIFMSIYDVESAPGPLFLVGDPKQAIYSFRNADLHTYLQASERAQTACTLLSNQRSVEGLINATNALFTTNPGGFVLPGIGYQAVGLGGKKRAPFVDRSDPGSASLRIWRLPADERGQYPTRDAAHELAVKATAAEISRLLCEGAAGRITLEDRPLRGGDIAVLVRTHRQGRWIKEALGAFGIGSVELSRESIFATRDAEDLERVLNAMLEPAQRRLLLAALATELMGMNATEVEAVSLNDASLAEWTSRFDELRATWLARGFGVMFRRWIDREGVSRRLLARADGERRMTNLLHLGELLHQVAQEQPMPGALLRWLATQRAGASTGDEAQVRLESDRNLVQIVTIHKAKGLEYGIVFCPFAWDGFMQARGDPYAIDYHDDSGNAVIDFRPGASKESNVQQQRRIEQAAERVRLIYVALTRAVYRCYLVAGCYVQQSGGGAPSPKPSTRSVLNWLASKTKVAYAQWLKLDRETAEIEQAWRRIADEGAPHILLAELPRTRGSNLSDTRTEREGLSALPAPKRIDPGWRIGSFTALAAGVGHEAAAFDHDARIAPPVESVVPDDLPADDILHFPRGPSAGDCVHAMFERADFTDLLSWDGALKRALALHPQRGGNLSGAAVALHRAMLRGLIENVLTTPLERGLTLGEIPMNRRLNELGFHLPAASLSAARLNAWLRSNGYPTPRLGFEALQGYLHGFIDLTFESGGRFYVLDWKSNHLGYARQHYGAERVAGAMQEHGYYLQAVLYALAVHRYLGRRVSGYDYERHFGGVLYLFVRGVRPGWVDAKGKPLGVWFQRPAASTLASLDALLAGKPAAKAA